MNIRTRRIIMYSFILVFLILAPLVIFYASGYRFDFKRYKILKTGTLMVEAKDIKKADLYLNGKLYEEKFDEKMYIYNLLPGEYEVKMEKEGYYPWQKNIYVYSSITSFAKDVVLFKKEVPLQIIDGQVINFSLSPDYQNIVYILANNAFWELYNYNLEFKENTFLARYPEGDQLSLNWAASSKKILLKIDKNYFLFDVENKKPGPTLSEIIDFQPEILKWDSQSDNLLYAFSKKAFYKIDLFNKKGEKIYQTEKPVKSEFLVEGNDLFYLQETESHNILNKYNFSFKTDKKIYDLSNSQNYIFIPSTNNFIGLIDKNLQKLYLIKKVITDNEININASEAIQEFNAQNAVWDKDEKQLLFYNDFEVFIYDTEKNEQNFINRFGQIIQKINWYPTLSYLVIQFKSQLQIIDLTSFNGAKPITEITKFDEITNFSLDRKGEIIYFNGKIGKQSGLYKINLR